MLTDKDYIATSEGLLFNVIGYDHPHGAYLVNLKYAHGRKWSDGYAAARQWLNANHPQYVDRYIQAPVERIDRVWRPRERLVELRAQHERSRLHDLALRLIDELARALDLSSNDFGLTDSLLWGEGGEESDIDVVVFGDRAAGAALRRIRETFALDDFQRLSVENYSRDIKLLSGAAAREVERRENKGLFRGERFSIRAVREPTPESLIWEPVEARSQLQLTISGADGSLYFPATYETSEGVRLVSFCTAHEMIFRAGDRVEARGVWEEAVDTNGRTLRRFVVIHNADLCWNPSSVS